LLTVSRSFMNVVKSVLWRMAIILKANKVNLFVSSVLFVSWYHSPNFLDTPRTPNFINPASYLLHTTKVYTYICLTLYIHSYLTPKYSTDITQFRFAQTNAT
jgi:hypothetical protein